MAASVDLVIRMIADTKRATADIKKAGDDVSGFARGVKKAAVPAAIALAAIAAAAVAATNAAADDAQAAAILANNLKNTAGATQSQIDATEKYIDTMAKATGVADDQLRPAMSKLAGASGSVEQAHKDLATALDVAVSSGSDVETVSKAIAKGYGGSTTSLKKLVPSLSDAAIASGDMNTIMGELADKTGGSAAAAADTAAGKFEVMKVKMGEAQEEIGAALLPAMSTLADLGSRVATAIQDHPRLFTAVAIAIGALAAAILIANAAFIVLDVVASPVILIILAIVAAVALVVAIIVLLWKKSETFRDIVLAVWDGVKTAAKTYFEFLKFWFELIWPIAKAAFEKIKDVIGTVVDWAKDKFDTWFPIIKQGWEDLGKKGKDAFDKVHDAIQPVIDKLVTFYDDHIAPIVAFVVDHKDAIAAPFVNALGPVGALIDKLKELNTWLDNVGNKGSAIKPGMGPGTTSAAAPVTSSRTVAAPRVSIGARGSTVPAGAVVINVTGAVDPEAVARQIQRILAGHNRRIGLAS